MFIHSWRVTTVLFLCILIHLVDLKRYKDFQFYCEILKYSVCCMAQTVNKRYFINNVIMALDIFICFFYEICHAK